MKLTIEIEMDNSAFDDNSFEESKRIVNKAVDSICFEDCDLVKLYDINGNHVGEARTTL